MDFVRATEGSFKNTLPYPAEFLSKLHTLRAAALETPQVLDEALKHAKTLDFKQRVKITKLRSSLNRFHAFYDDDLFDEIHMHPEDTRDWPTTLGDVESCIIELFGSLGSH